MSQSKKHQSALHEKVGIVQPEIVSQNSVSKIQQFRRVQPTAKELMEGILAGNIRDLSRGITLIESANPLHLEKAHQLINGVLPHANRSIRIGITGVPGVGKSTFIEAFGKFLTNLGHKVAVLAVDPSSSISHGSILGDKTRMEELVNDANAFIRPSASGDSFGGVARKTRESISLCEAAGFNIILVETVGVGQNETTVHGMVDFFLLLKISGAGDELQGIKRGIMEMADAIVINKADGDNIKKANMAKVEFKRALHLFPAKESGWNPVVQTSSAITKDGIEAVWQTIDTYVKFTKQNGYFESNRNHQNQYWLMETIQEQLKNNFFQNKEIQIALAENKKAVQNNELSPFVAAQILLEKYFKEIN